MKYVRWAALLPAALVAIAACGSNSPQHHAAASHPATAAAVQQTQPPPPPAQPAAEASWEENSPGYQSWLDVGSDMHKLSEDLNAGNSLAIIGTGGVGFRLAEAAGAALQNPSPVDRHQYKQAMANFGFMGVSLTNNNFTDASRFAKKALGFLHTWAGAAQPGASGMESCGNWNLPQSDNC